jgi:hypothetical protein
MERKEKSQRFVFCHVNCFLLLVRSSESAVRVSLHLAPVHKYYFLSKNVQVINYLESLSGQVLNDHYTLHPTPYTLPQLVTFDKDARSKVRVVGLFRIENKQLRWDPGEVSSPRERPPRQRIEN